MRYQESLKFFILLASRGIYNKYLSIQLKKVSTFIIFYPFKILEEFPKDDNRQMRSLPPRGSSREAGHY